MREQVRWDRIRYASVWEDADVLCAALAPVAPGERLLSIASSGDNALALLTLDPAEVVAVDFNPAQLACVELRVAAFRNLDDADLLRFLGAEPTLRRFERDDLYRDVIRRSIPEESRAFWDAHRHLIEGGVIHEGKFERYLRAFRRYVLPLIHSRRTIEALRLPRTRDEQRSWYARHWESWSYRMLFRLFFSRAVMGRMGRDPALFTHVEGTVGERILARTRYALLELPTDSNPYLAYIMTGNYCPEALPSYLRPENREAIRSRLDRLRVIRGGVQEAHGTFAGFNLSDIFEYMDAAEHEPVYGALLEKATPGGRLVYWNLLAPRECPACFRSRVTPLDALAADLHRRDRAWFYSALRVDEVSAHPERGPAV